MKATSLGLNSKGGSVADRLSLPPLSPTGQGAASPRCARLLPRPAQLPAAPQVGGRGGGRGGVVFLRPGGRHCHSSSLPLWPKPRP